MAVLTFCLGGILPRRSKKINRNSIFILSKFDKRYKSKYQKRILYNPHYFIRLSGYFQHSKKFHLQIIPIRPLYTHICCELSPQFLHFARDISSNFDIRPNPVLDFSAHPGTDVYATGDGTVVKVGWETGYGNTIEIDHGFGYLTRYAHLQGFNTKVGKKVVRGEVIGKVGSTGKSTGPHLHYEVHVKGQVVNPVNYYFMDLSAEDYEKMIQLAANHGKVFD